MAARWRDGSVRSTSHISSATIVVGSGGRGARTRSSTCRRPHERHALTTEVRRYAGALVALSQLRCTETNASCTSSSAIAWRPVSRYARRTIGSYRSRYSATNASSRSSSGMVAVIIDGETLDWGDTFRTMPLSRRQFLIGSASALVLAACSGGDDDDDAAATTTTS